MVLGCFLTQPVQVYTSRKWGCPWDNPKEQVFGSRPSSQGGHPLLQFLVSTFDMEQTELQICAEQTEIFSAVGERKSGVASWGGGKRDRQTDRQTLLMALTDN